MKSDLKSLFKRGFTDDNFDANYRNCDSSELVSMLQSKKPQDRTSAAKILGKRKELSAVASLCTALIHETKLYSKIAICDALAEIGEPAVKSLTRLLGKIGANQHDILPDKPFLKKSYPLPRDIAARTLIRIGAAALPELEKILECEDVFMMSEAIDAVGFISFYSNEKSLLNKVLFCHDKFKSNDVIKWKTVRALSAFPGKKTEEFLANFIKIENNEIIKIEAERSLGIAAANTSEDESEK